MGLLHWGAEPLRSCKNGLAGTPWGEATAPLLLCQPALTHAGILCSCWQPVLTLRPSRTCFPQVASLRHLVGYCGMLKLG